MCRLFGFRSVLQSGVHSSLISADNALVLQSNANPDGWGVSYYIHGTPHLIKSAITPAIKSNIFKKVSGVVSSNTVLAHIRKATLGDNSLLNTHPFQYANWMFAHNGNIKNFKKHHDEILSHVDPMLKHFILGDTDSELLFYFFLSYINKSIELARKDVPIDKLIKALRVGLDELIKIIGEYSQIDDAGEQETYLTFILTNGTTMVAHQGGKHLFYSTYKVKCPERETCSSFNESCEAPSLTGKVNHLIFSSEPLSGENIWLAMPVGQLMGVDENMVITVDI